MKRLGDLGRAKRLGIWLVAAALLLGGLGWWWTRATADEAGAGPEHSLLVQRQPFVASLAFAGKIAPGDAIAVTAPFDGTVRAVHFVYGSHVAAGEPLLALDTEEILAARNQAEATYLKASKPAAEIANWKQAPEVAAARRRVTLAALELARLERELRESRRLLDKGLIPRNEHDGVEQQLAAQHMAAAAARDELAETLARGDGVAARVARLDLENAHAELRRSEGDIGKALVRAPASGVMVAPPVAGARGAEGPLHPGTRVTRGQLLATLARDGGLSVTFEVDEADVNALAVGQPVVVTGSGFAGLALRGRLSAVAAETSSSGPATGPTRFVARAQLDALPPGQASNVRIGMTAAVAVTTYQAPAAIVLPPEAVQGSAPLARVRVRANGRIVDRQIRVGRVTPAGVEVLSGLRAGETVVWTQPSPAADTQQQAS
ncbi:efflux RND transporter periplasmic adaptor subunit [Sphingomonas sp. DT-207]|uniref:efflux RND transporter periplasmic adaptor subunit n=1 Tax=Sphingomonas sp. DT-207 TaxID=3396167 RepID=UPI003F1E2820